MKKQVSASGGTQRSLLDEFLEWFKAEHPGDWSSRNQMPEWKAFQAGAISALVIQVDHSKRSKK